MFGAYSKPAAGGKRSAGGDAATAGAGEPRVSDGYARALLATLGYAADEIRSGPAEAHPALAAAATGLMALTGYAGVPPVAPPGHLAACARGALAALRTLAGDHGDAPALALVDGATLLGERAAVLGLERRGTTSAGGYCRLVPARDGWLAINLPRADDLAMVPAWLEATPATDPWPAIAGAVAGRRVRALVARARLLGLAVAIAAPPPPAAPPWCRLAAVGRRRVPPPARPPFVVDLSALWAGPLAGDLLARAGARVVKVESSRRPDGARSGPAAFFDLLNGGKESVALDFAAAAGRSALMALLARADIVIESSRPRAMHQLGIDPAALVRTRPGLTWISITAYGRRGAAGGWIGFGDDAAAAAGLAYATGRRAGGTTPLFCGDAVADPLTGMHAAAAALAAYRRGGGVLAALTLRDVAAHVLAFGPEPAAAAVRLLPGRRRAAAWEVAADGVAAPILPPRARSAEWRARPLGADTEAVLKEIRVR